MKEDRKLIHELPNGQFRDATPEETILAEQAEKYRKQLEIDYRRIGEELVKIRKTCTHPVCFDEEGFPYHIRICVVCGNRSLL